MKLATWVETVAGRKTLRLATLLSPGHQYGMRVAVGGSMCANCRFVSDDQSSCSNLYFRAWRRDQGAGAESAKQLPERADRYCCDAWEGGNKRA